MSETKTHVIDGKTYVEVDRKARVGDKILIVDAWETGGKYDNGSIIEAQRLDSDICGIENDAVATEGNQDGFISDSEYVVIEPLDTVDATQATPQVLDMLANLARRVSSLEEQLRDTQRNVERLAEELADNTHRSHEIERDIMEMERRLKHPAFWARQEDVIELNEKVEMALDYIVTLDERTRPQADPAFETITLPKWFVGMLTKLDGGAKR